MTTEQRDTKYGHTLKKNVRIFFGELPLDRTYRYFIPYVHKQFDKEYNESNMTKKHPNRPKWYVDFLGYYTEDIEARLEDSEAPYWIKANKLMRQGFSGYGFFTFLEFCKDKFNEDDLEDNDGIIVTFRRGKRKNLWYMDRVELLKEKDYPAFAQVGVR